MRSKVLFFYKTIPWSQERIPTFICAEHFLSYNHITYRVTTSEYVLPIFNAIKRQINSNLYA